MTSKQQWLPAELETLKDLYPNHTAKFVANVLGREVGSIYRKAFELGVEKSDEFWAGDASGRVRQGQQDPRLKATQFKKGHTSWNKGTKGITGLHPSSRATQFKKGRAPQESRNYLPIGSLRLSKDGWLERKVTDDHPVPARRWVAEHRLVWEREHGPIPDGHIVIFRDKRRTVIPEEITIDRLECITKAENLRRNRARDPELLKLIQLKGAITRQLNRITKEAKQNV